MRIRHILNKTNLLLICASVFFYSCADSKKNKVNVDEVGSSTSNLVFGPNGGPNFNGSQLNEISQIMQRVQCRSGQRLQQVQTFHTTGFNHSGSRTLIAGTFQQGALPGQVTSLYVGTSVWNDLMFVSKVTEGSQVRGYNVSLSMCSMVSNNGIPLIDDRRPLSNFHATRGIIVGEDNHCGYGSVDSAQYTFMQAAAFQFTDNNGYRINLSPWAVWTTFFKPACNGQY